MTNNDIVLKYYDFLKELQIKFAVDEDCMQMIFVALLEYNNDRLNELDSIINKDGTTALRCWLVRLVKVFWFGKHSDYNRLYNRWYSYISDERVEESDDEESTGGDWY